MRAVTACSFEHADRADHVHLGVLDRTFHGHTDVRLGREVEDRLGADLVEELVEWLADVVDVEHGSLGHVLALPGRQ